MCLLSLSLPADSHADILRLPRFANYKRGDVTNRLYVKNLHRKVSEEVLRGVFARFLLPREEAQEAEEVPQEAASLLVIDLKTKGRLKGQAFVEFPHEEQAERALQGALGVQLEGKPMVIVSGSCNNPGSLHYTDLRTQQFARSNRNG